MIKVKNMKSACVLFTCLLLYDIFWVLLSPHLFGESVMVSVATKTIAHPVTQISRKLMAAPAAGFAAPTFDLPLMIIIPAFDGTSSCILGLGDLAIPSIMLSFIYRLELPHGRRHYWVGLLGYTAGLFLAMVCSVLWRMPLPALVFLIPSSLVPVVVSSVVTGDLRELFGMDEDLDVELRKLGPAGHGLGDSKALFQDV